MVITIGYDIDSSNLPQLLRSLELKCIVTETGSPPSHYNVCARYCATIHP